MMNLQQMYRYAWLRYVVAPVLVLVAAALRIWPLHGLELRIPYVTFYPAVMIAALYGGLPYSDSACLVNNIFLFLAGSNWSRWSNFAQKV